MRGTSFLKRRLPYQFNKTSETSGIKSRLPDIFRVEETSDTFFRREPVLPDAVCCQDTTRAAQLPRNFETPDD
jgi:hypothetical protein